MRTKQRTIARAAEVSGIGMFSGTPCRLRLVPAPIGSGITFVRTDLPDRPRIPVHVDALISRPRRTAVARGAADVETIEHVLSAIQAMGVDNLDVEVNAPEIPGLDGSAAPFAQMIQSAGYTDQDAPRKVIVLKEPVSVTEGAVSLVAMPAAEGLTVSYTLDYGLPYFGAQHYTVAITPERYAKDIAPSRTFCLEAEVQALLAQGMGKGASYDNTLVIGPQGVIRNTLRFPDEFVRHKILDLIGDLLLLGAPLQAHVVAIRSGHSDNVKLVRKVLQAMAPPPKKSETFLDVREILKILPHRYPFLLIDKVIELDSYKRAVGIKNVTFNEPFFQGHFPGQPIMPGVLQVEAMAQLAGALLMRKAENANKLAVLLSIDKVRLRRSVVPGDQLRIEAVAQRVKNRTGQVYTSCTVDEKLVCDANMKFMLVDPA